MQLPLTTPPIGADHGSTQFQTWYSLITKKVNILFNKHTTYQLFFPKNSISPSSNPATSDSRNSIPVLDFDDTVSESTFWIGYLPYWYYPNSTLKVIIHWTATSATSGDVTWEVSFDNMNNTDIDSDSYDTASSNHSTCSGTSGIITTTEIFISTIDNISPGSPFKFKVARLPLDASDNMVGDAELIAVELQSFPS